LNEEEFDEEGL